MYGSFTFVLFSSILLCVSMAKKLLRFENCRILKDGKILENDYLLVRDGKIVNYMDVFFDEERSPDIRVDCKGALLSPGLIDIQVNGQCFRL